jgi:pilus assembly protein CpaF
MVDARLPDGSRVNAIIPPLVAARADADDPEVLAGPYTLADLARFGSLDADAATFLGACVRAR